MIYAGEVGRCAPFYSAFGFEERFRLPAEGPPGYVGLRRGDSEAVVSAASPHALIGVEVGARPRFELMYTWRTSTTRWSGCEGPARRSCGGR